MAASPGAAGWPPDGRRARGEPFLGPGCSTTPDAPEKTALRAFQGRVKTPIGPKSGMVRLDRAVKMWERAGAVPAAADHPARRWLAPAASVEAWPATAAVRPLGGSAWPLGWRNRGGLCSTGHGQAVRRPAHPRRRRRAPSPRQARPRRSAEAVLRPNGRGGVRPGPAGARRRQRGRRAGRRPGPGRTATLARRLHGRDGGIPQTSSSPAGWLAQGPSTFGPTSTRQGSRPPKSWAAW